MCLQLGARKGLGATKVAANFDDIEREAIMAEKLKMEVRCCCVISLNHRLDLTELCTLKTNYLNG
jgi:hypothetical protein